MKSAFTYEHICSIILVVILGIFSYSNTFQFSFHFDDEPNIVDNTYLRDLSNFWSPTDSRWLGFLTFAFNYHISGLDTTSYHIVNITIHILTAVLIYWLIVLTMRTPFFRPPDSASQTHRSTRDLIALFASLIFVIHPIQTQAVTYIVQRFASLATLFYMLSFVMYVKARLNQQSATSDQHIEEGQKVFKIKSLFCYLISVTAAVLAMKTKEIAFMLPVMIALYEVMFFEGEYRRRMKYLIPYLIVMLIIPLSLVGIGKPIGELLSDVGEVTRVSATLSRWDYLFTEFRVIMTYIRLIFMPMNQNLDYDYPIYDSFFDINVLLSFLFLFVLFCCAVYLYYCSRYSVSKMRLVSFGILWFLINLMLESSVIPLKNVIFEHRVYLPSIGVTIVIGTLISIVVERLRDTWNGIARAVVAGMIVIIFGLTGTTYVRNKVWKDEITLWEDVVNKSPNKARGHYNLGVAYQAQGIVDKSIEHYHNAIVIDPNYQDAQGNIGFMYLINGELDKAIKHLEMSARLSPDDAKSHLNLGIAYKHLGMMDKSEEHLGIYRKLSSTSIKKSDPHH